MNGGCLGYRKAPLHNGWSNGICAVEVRGLYFYISMPRNNVSLCRIYIDPRLYSYMDGFGL